MTNRLLFFAVFGVVMTLTLADVSKCTYTDTAGKTYNLSSLINPFGYYTFTQQVWSIGGFSLDSLSADSQSNVTFYLQVCRNLATPPTGCNGTAAVYSVTSDGKCMAWGDATVAVFDPNPYKDGVNLKMYHGTPVDHITNNAAIIYFVCNNGVRVKDAKFMFEHVKGAINQAHFKVFTDLAC